MISPQKQSPTLDMAEQVVRDTISKTPASVLAIMYKEVAHSERDRAIEENSKKDIVLWEDVIQLCDISSDIDVAQEFMIWMDKAISLSKPHIKKQFMHSILNGIIEVSRRS